MKRIFSKIILVALIFGLFQPLEIQANENNAKIAFGLGTIAAGLTSMIAARLFCSENKKDRDDLKRCEKKARKLNNDLDYLDAMQANNTPGRTLFYLQERSINQLSMNDRSKDQLRFAAGIAGNNPNNDNARQFLDARVEVTKDDIMGQKNTNDNDLEFHKKKESMSRLFTDLFFLTGFYSTIFGVYKLSQVSQ